MGIQQAITNIDYTLPPLPVEWLTSAIDAHLQYRGDEGQAVALYASRLSWFLRWLRLRNSQDFHLVAADFVEFRLWLAKIRSKRGNKPLNQETQQDALKRLRSALRWAYHAGRLAADYSSWVSAANHGTVDPMFTFDDELDEVDTGSHPSGQGEEMDPGISTSLVRSWLELFISSKRLRGLSETTLFDYHLRIDYYLAFAQKNGLSSNALSTATIELYLMQRRATVSPFTEHGDFAVLRNFCGWLVKRHYLSTSPMLDLSGPRSHAKECAPLPINSFAISI